MYQPLLQNRLAPDVRQPGASNGAGWSASNLAQWVKVQGVSRAEAAQLRKADSWPDCMRTSPRRQGRPQSPGAPACDTSRRRRGQVACSLRGLVQCAVSIGVPAVQRRGRRRESIHRHRFEPSSSSPSRSRTGTPRARLTGGGRSVLRRDDHPVNPRLPVCRRSISRSHTDQQRVCCGVHWGQKQPRRRVRGATGRRRSSAPRRTG
jgi:hypothetical protein